MPNIRQVMMGAAGAVESGYSLWSWGRGDQGATGLNVGINKSSPTQIGTGAGWAMIGGGQGSAFGIKDTGALFAWGNNSNGRLGLGTSPSVDVSSPVQVGSLTNWSKVSGRGVSGGTSGIKTDGTLWAWGKNNFGQLGMGDLVYRSSPVQVGSLTTWESVTNGYAVTLAVKTDGTLWAWGWNQHGQLGQGNGEGFRQSSPIQIGGLTTWHSGSTRGEHMMARLDDGKLYVWGRGTDGRLGLGDQIYKSSPTQVGSLTDWAYLGAGDYNSLAVKSDGTLWGWGANQDGRLGDGTKISRSSPVQVGSATNWAKVWANNNFTMALTTDGTLWAWGASNRGQVGQGNIIYHSVPVQIGSLTNWVQGAVGTQVGFGLQE